MHRDILSSPAARVGMQALVAEYIIEELCRIPVEVEYASEFRYRNPIINKGDVIIAISQSGETADTLVAIEKAKEQGAFIFGIVNVVGSSIARASHAGAYTHAGPGNWGCFNKSIHCSISGIDYDRFKNCKRKRDN